MTKPPVVVTGYGLVAPTVLNARGLFALLGGHGSCLRQHPDRASHALAGFIDEQQWQAIDAAVDDQSAHQSRHHLLTRYVAEQALAQAGLTAQDFRTTVSGLFIGCPLGEDLQTRHLSQWLGVNEYVSPHQDACTAGTTAIGNAYRAITQGEIELALCGGVELLPDEVADRTAQGLAPSEGAALVVLESASHARRRGARTLGRVLGYADCCQNTLAVAGQDYAQCMQAALDDAGLDAHQVRHVHLHSPSPLTVDHSEARAVQQVFGNALCDTTFTASKGAVGHSPAGSGAIEAVMSLMTLQLGVLLPSAGHSLDRTATTRMNFPPALMQQNIDAVLSNCFAINGTSSSLVLGRA